MPGGNQTRAFTLVELILVMGIMTIMVALTAPTLSHSMRARTLEQEAARLLALTEFARDEAISQGAPMVVWIDSKAQRYGMDPKTGYSGVDIHRQYTLNQDVHFDVIEGGGRGSDGQTIEFAPDGAPELSGLSSIRLADRFQSAITVSRRTDGWGYEILKR